MIVSEILKEKYKVQKRLSEECGSASAYLAKAHSAVEEMPRSRGITLHYAKMPNRVAVTDR